MANGAAVTNRQSSAVRAGDGVDLVPAYPSLREAAKLIGVSASTLSRRADIARVYAGQETRVPAAEVIRLAAVYRRRALGDVAAGLVQRVQRCAPAQRRAFEEEVDEAFERLEQPPSMDAADAAALLAALDRMLPPELAAQVRSHLAPPDADEEGCGGVVGWDPGTD